MYLLDDKPVDYIEIIAEKLYFDQIKLRQIQFSVARVVIQT